MGQGAKYVVRLSGEERRQLQSMVDVGRGSKETRQRARVLLKADESQEGPGWTDERTAEFAEVSLSTVHRVRQQKYAPIANRSQAEVLAGRNQALVFFFVAGVLAFVGGAGVLGGAHSNHG